jgi:hypothetical protein
LNQIQPGHNELIVAISSILSVRSMLRRTGRSLDHREVIFASLCRQPHLADSWQIHMLFSSLEVEGRD